MFKKIITIVLLGVMMATLMSVILGCEDIDSKTANAIQDKLAEKYGESFTVTSLGNRVGYDTVTAYVYADKDPSMRFTAKLDKNLELVFDDYGYRLICRKTEQMLHTAFAPMNIEGIAFCNFEKLDNTLGIDALPYEYVQATGSSYAALAFVVKDSAAVTAENILEGVRLFCSEFEDIEFRIRFYILAGKDYAEVYDKAQRDTQTFSIDRLVAYGATGTITEIRIQYDSDGCSLTPDELSTMLYKGAE